MQIKTADTLGLSQLQDEGTSDQEQVQCNAGVAKRWYGQRSATTKSKGIDAAENRSPKKQASRSVRSHPPSWLHL